jgi:hypothetical protein
LQDLLAAAASSTESIEPDEREKLWNQIEAAWPQLAEAMLSRLNEIFWNGSEMNSTKQVLAPRENIFD